MLFRFLYPEAKGVEASKTEISGFSGMCELDALLIKILQAQGDQLLVEAKDGFHRIRGRAGTSIVELKTLAHESGRALVAAIYRTASIALAIDFDDVKAGEGSFELMLSNVEELLFRFEVRLGWPQGFDLIATVFPKFPYSSKPATLEAAGFESKDIPDLMPSIR
jgi:hypothetical protein